MNLPQKQIADSAILQGNSVQPVGTMEEESQSPAPVLTSICPTFTTDNDDPIHQVLFNYELLVRIFSFQFGDPFDFDEPNPRNQRTSSLLHAALTCKAFRDPALDVLWRSMNTFIPLFKLFPAFQMVRDDYVFRGVISEADWARFYHYARKVKEFVYPSFQDDNRLDHHAKIRLAQLSRSPLLPTVRRYTCYDVRSLGPFIHPLFISPTLEYLKIGLVTDTQDASVGTLLSILVEEVPTLRTLILGGTLSYASLSYVVELKDLRNLELLGMGEVVDSSFLFLLSQLEKLEELVIDLYNSPSSTFAVGEGFKRLKKLHITAFHSVIEHLLLDLAPEVQLESLGFITPPAPLPTGWENDLESLARTVIEQWPQTLRRITIDREWSSYIPLLLTKPLITVFLRLPNIEHFIISEFLVDLDDGDVVQLATAWPGLRHLRIPHDDNTTPPTTFDILPTLARLCPHLEHLEIPLDIKRLPLLSLDSDNYPQSIGLRFLYILNDNPPTETRELLLLARHFDRMFPRLQKLGRSRMKDLDNVVWEKVFAMIQAFRSVRSELYLIRGS